MQGRDVPVGTKQTKQQANCLLSRFGTYPQYVDAKFVYETLQKIGIYKEFKTMLDSQADFFDVKVPNHVFFANVRLHFGHMEAFTAFRLIINSNRLIGLYYFFYGASTIELLTNSL